MRHSGISKIVDSSMLLVLLSARMSMAKTNDSQLCPVKSRCHALEAPLGAINDKEKGEVKQRNSEERTK